MSQEPESLDPRSQPGVRGYTLVSLVALLVLVLVLAQRDLGWLALLPLLTGCVAVLAYWGIGPLLVILCVGGALVVHTRFPIAGLPSRGPSSAPGDLLLAGALLAYCAAQYRLQSLVRSIFPADPRHRRRLPRGTPVVLPLLPAEQARSPELVGANEIMQLLLTVLGCTGLAAVTWMALANFNRPLDFDPWEWPVVAVAWLGCLIAGLTWVLAGHLRWRRASPEESYLYLQDQFWRQTRREQSRLNRWLVWYRLRRQRRLRRQEKP
jgi:hypothetical protein